MQDAIRFAIFFPLLIALTFIIAIPAILILIRITDYIRAKAYEHHD